MSITHERLNEIAHIASRNTADKLSTFSIDDEYVEIFAHALLKAVEAEMGIWTYDDEGNACVSLPLIKEE